VIPQQTLDELVALRNRVSDLEAELANLKGQQQDQLLNVHQNLGATVGQSRMLIAMAKGGIMSREQLMHFGIQNAEWGDIRLVDSMIKRIRQRLPWITIEAHYGIGSELTGDSLTRVHAAMNARPQ